MLKTEAPNTLETKAPNFSPKTLKRAQGLSHLNPQHLNPIVQMIKDKIEFYQISVKETSREVNLNKQGGNS